MRTILLIILIGLIAVTADTFEQVESSSAYMERINDDGTITVLESKP